MLRKIRVITASVIFVLTTLLFLDFTGTLHWGLGWLAKIQLIPAILAVNVAIIIALVVLTLLFGRIYCSVICPLGIFQDGVTNLSKRRKVNGKKKRFSYSKAKSWLRYSILGLFVLSILSGISAVVSLLDPYSAYGRIAANLFAPLYRWTNNLLAYVAEWLNSYAIYSTEVWIKGWITFGVAAITLVVVGILAWRHGRTYCNAICPAGSFLGLLSRFSLFKITFNTEKCTNCKACERDCKASCINAKEMYVDHSRCVNCFNCMDDCKFGAMQYKFTLPRNKKKIEAKPLTAESVASVNAAPDGYSRRNMLTLLGTVAVTGLLKAQQLPMHVDGGLADIKARKAPVRKTPIVPPGALSAKNMQNHCTACQLCVSACPNNILKPSHDLVTFMQPEMSYEHGYCRPECVECSQVCPAGAIQPITTAEKSALSIGIAVWIKDYCVVNTDEVQCHNCERHCPTGAIMLVDRDPGYSDSLKIPVVNNELCIGCGACENLCPARPFSALYVEGNERHRAI